MLHFVAITVLIILMSSWYLASSGYSSTWRASTMLARELELALLVCRMRPQDVGALRLPDAQVLRRVCSSLGSCGVQMRSA
jgi:hypothetical protein